MPPEVLAKVHAKALETRRQNKLKAKAANWEDQERIRIREHIARLNKELENAPTAKDKLFLAQTLAKLYQPAGLANAGNYRPTAPKSATKPSLGPLD